MVDALKLRYNFASWARKQTLNENLFVRNYFPADRAVTQWQLVKVDEIKIGNAPKCNRSFWMNPGIGATAIIRCDAYECDSLEAAHEFLIQILGTFHSPLVEQREDLRIGDVAFAPPGEASIAFARANVVFIVSRAGRGEYSVTDFAAQLDADLAGKPEPSEAVDTTDLDSVLRRVAGISGRSGERTSEEERVQFKFFSPTGHFDMAGDDLIYRSEAESEPEITMFAIDSQGTAVVQNLRPSQTTEEESS
jgi:hypothetical protein